MSRYRDRDIYENMEDVYEELRDKRGVRKINHYATPFFRALTAEDHSELSVVVHTWTIGDRFYKLSHKYYGSTEHWWLIAKFNGKPTETHVKIGDKIRIPLPFDKALSLLEEE